MLIGAPPSALDGTQLVVGIPCAKILDIAVAVPYKAEGLIAAGPCSDPLELHRQERISNGPVLSRTSSSSSGMGGGGPSSSMQLQLVDDPIPGGFEAAARSQPLKRLDFVRAQGGFWLTWVRSEKIVQIPGRPTERPCQGSLPSAVAAPAKCV